MNTTVTDQQMKLEMARAFTQAYRDHLDDPVPVREAACLATFYPAICTDIQDEDLIAGRRRYDPLAAFGVEVNTNENIDIVNKDSIPRREWSDEDRALREKIGVSSCGFCFDYSNLRKIADRLPADDPRRAEMEDMIEFWLEHSSRRQYNRAIPDEIGEHLGTSTFLDLRYANGLFRLCCYSIEHDKLLQLGIPGLRELIQEKQQEKANDPKAQALYEGMLLALDVLVNTCRHYKEQARNMAADCTDDRRRAQLERLAHVLNRIQAHKPETLHEAMQLFWLYNLLSDLPNYGRMDMYLGDFYVRDIDNGTLTEEEALELLTSLWTIISEIRPGGGNTAPNARIIVGGKGRRNESNADRFALAAMEVSRRLKVAEPNLTLRFYDGQDPALMQKALDLIGEGCIHPTLYNDDAQIPGIVQAYRVPACDAEQYLPQGCGELLLDHMGIGSPNNILNYVSGLDLVLHNGWDRCICEQRGLKLGTLDAFDTFEKLLDAFKQQIDFTFGVLARRHAIEHRVEAEHISFLFLSMLTDDCIERGRSLFDNGARYLGGVIETFGLTNVADSLYAIRERVYRKKEMTLKQLVQMLDADWKGYEKERRRMLDLPKFGNDHPELDALHTELSRCMCETASKRGREAGLHFFLPCNLNPGAGYYRYHTAASADGRHYGEAMAYGNAPTAGRDREGITALLNSMAKHDKGHAGYVHNLKVSKTLFAPENRPKLETVCDTYFKQGGCQLMITALNRDDIQHAMEKPEEYENLLVRVAGWTARWGDLSDDIRREILHRTFYE